MLLKHVQSYIYAGFYLKITEKKTVIVLADIERFHSPLFCHGIVAHRVSAIEFRVNKEVGASILFFTAQGPEIVNVH